MIPLNPKQYPTVTYVMASEDATFEVVRFYKGGHGQEIIKKGLSRDEVKEFCEDDETSSKTCEKPENVKRTEEKGEWFCGFREE